MGFDGIGLRGSSLGFFSYFEFHCLLRYFELAYLLVLSL